MESIYLAHYGVKGMKWGVRKAEEQTKQELDDAVKAYWNREPGSSRKKVKRAEARYIKASNRALKVSGKTDKEMWKLNKDLGSRYSSSKSATEKKFGSKVLQMSKTANRLKECAKPFSEFTDLYKTDRSKFEEYCRKGLSDDYDKAVGTKQDYKKTLGLSKEQFIRSSMEGMSSLTIESGEDRYIRETRNADPIKWRKDYAKASVNFHKESSKLVKDVLGEYSDMKPKGWGGSTADHALQMRVQQSLQYPDSYEPYD